MNRTQVEGKQVEGKWDQVKGKLRSQWGKLTDDDVEHVSGKRDQLAGALVERYGIMKEQAEGQIDEWLANLDQSNQQARQDKNRS
jgi:uncharacterized protein YjbJ (UPF0337 family)